jgi:putative heme-binding domain-containing protein
VKPFFRSAVAALFFCAAFFSARAQVVNKPPVPEWISIGSDKPERVAVFQREFVAPQTLLKSVLLGAVEGSAEVRLNGVLVGEFSGSARAATFDLTRHVKAGATNVLLVRVSNLTNAPSLAVLVELNADLARQSWVASDASWGASGIGDPEWFTVAAVRREWPRARSGGRVDAKAGANPFTPDKAIDAYNSWKLASGAAQATDAATFTTLPGFKVELIRSAQTNEGSWIALAFDPKGRLTIAREKRGLLRLSLDATRVTQVEVINDTLLECRGLLYAHGALYANANNSKMLVRLRDTQGNGQFDEITELLKTDGGVGHGRNHVKLGPDGWLWIAHGNNVHLPKNVSTNSPLRNWSHDRLIPCPWDGSMFDGDVLLPAGHVLRMKPDGSEVQLWAGGFRNPLDVAFNERGDLFTFDADMEWDVGCSWYVANRVLHVVPGADFGWRRGTGRWPAWYPDTLPSVVNIGLASPTGVIFGYGAKFPEKYQKAFFICDWAYGRILAVHLTPKGASYTGTSELFVGGRPMNVTDACIGPDGAMWFTTGGRGTQSGLYRVTATESAGAASVTGVKKIGGEDSAVTKSASLTLPAPRDGEKLLREWNASPVGKNLGVAIELLRVRETNLIAQARFPERLTALRFDSMDERQRIAALRVMALNFIRLGAPDEALRVASLKWAEPHYPTASSRVNQMLVELLVYLRSPHVVAKTVPLLRAGTASEDLLHYPFFLRYARDGWTIEARREVFDALARAERMSGGRTFFSSIQNVRRELMASLTPEERVALAPVLNATNRVAQFTPPPARFVKDWKLADLEPRLGEVGKGRSFEGARAALLSAQCVLCHRVSNDPSFPNSVIGPELIGVGARFSRRDLLLHILDPSAVIDEKFRQVRLLLKDGDEVSGAIEGESGGKIRVRPNPLEDRLIEVAAANVRERRASEVSPMPAGLLNGLRAEQILDLLAYLEAAGDAKHRNFQP